RPQQILAADNRNALAPTSHLQGRAAVRHVRVVYLWCIAYGRSCLGAYIHTRRRRWGRCRCKVWRRRGGCCPWRRSQRRSPSSSSSTQGYVYSVYIRIYLFLRLYIRICLFQTRQLFIPPMFEIRSITTSAIFC
uniref:Uncharacterized protein n=1 Tax=Aegilops tauschii subsp. strangulata TaxID=200361 RepID=A0A453FL02_AEGTS